MQKVIEKVYKMFNGKIRLNVKKDLHVFKGAHSEGPIAARCNVKINIYIRWTAGR